MNKILQVQTFETNPPEWVDCDQYNYDMAEEDNRRVIHSDLINCLAYALRFWEQEPSFKIYYCVGHAINSHVPITNKEWLPIEDYGYNWIIKAFDGLLGDYEIKLLNKYFDTINSSTPSQG